MIKNGEMNKYGASLFQRMRCVKELEAEARTTVFAVTFGYPENKKVISER
jgi:hypothetical protein